MTHEEKVDCIMSEFDFKRVRRAMVSLNWKWCERVNDDRRSIPSMKRIKATARGLLLGLKKYPSIATGGFYAKRSGRNYTLYFSVTESSTWL